MFISPPKSLPQENKVMEVTKTQPTRTGNHYGDIWVTDIFSFLSGTLLHEQSFILRPLHPDGFHFPEVQGFKTLKRQPINPRQRDRTQPVQLLLSTFKMCCWIVKYRAVDKRAGDPEFRWAPSIAPTNSSEQKVLLFLKPREVRVRRSSAWMESPYLAIRIMQQQAG